MITKAGLAMRAWKCELSSGGGGSRAKDAWARIRMSAYKIYITCVTSKIDFVSDYVITRVQTDFRISKRKRVL